MLLSTPAIDRTYYTDKILLRVRELYHKGKIMSEVKLTLNEQITPKLKTLGAALTSSTEHMNAFGNSVKLTAAEFESFEKTKFKRAEEKYNSHVKEFLNGMGNAGFEGAVFGAIGGGEVGSFGGLAGTIGGAAGGAIFAGTVDMARYVFNNASELAEYYDQYVAAKEAYEKAKRPVTKAAEAGYLENEDQELRWSPIVGQVGGIIKDALASHV